MLVRVFQLELFSNLYTWCLHFLGPSHEDEDWRGYEGPKGIYYIDLPGKPATVALVH